MKRIFIIILTLLLTGCAASNLKKVAPGSAEYREMQQVISDHCAMFNARDTRAIINAFAEGAVIRNWSIAQQTRVYTKAEYVAGLDKLIDYYNKNDYYFNNCQVVEAKVENDRAMVQFTFSLSSNGLDNAPKFFRSTFYLSKINGAWKITKRG